MNDLGVSNAAHQARVVAAWRAAAQACTSSPQDDTAARAAAAASETTSSAERGGQDERERLERRIRRFFERHDPGLAEHALTMSYGYRGREDVLFEWLHRKWGQHKASVAAVL